MKTVTCNECGSVMSHGHKRFHFDALFGTGESVKEYGFFVEKECARFNATNYDLCDRCFLIAVEAAFKHDPRAKE